MPHQCPTNDEGSWGSSRFVIGGALVGHSSFVLLEPLMFPPFDPTAAVPFDPRVQRGEYARQRMLTIEDLLLEQRILFLSFPIVSESADWIIKRLLYLQYEKKMEAIHLYINSPGGSVSATLAVYDTMQFLDAPIHTYCMGLAASG